MVTLPSIAILGAGSMGGAILTGLLAPSVLVDGGIRVTTRTKSRSHALESDGVRTFALEEDPDANALAVAGARVVLIAVKPAMVPELLTSIAPALEADAIVVSVAAGVTIATMAELVPATVMRAMPNTPALVGLAVTGVSAGEGSSADEREIVRTLFETVGTVLEVPEEQIDALGTVSGSGPAYFFFLIEEFARAAIDLGFTPEQASVLVNGTFRGAAELLHASGEEPAELRRRVTSPGGTTERAIAELQAADLRGLFARATAAALARTKELAVG